MRHTEHYKLHDSCCAVHNGPAQSKGECNCWPWIISDMDRLIIDDACKCSECTKPIKIEL